MLAFHVLAWVLSPTGDRRKESKGGEGGSRREWNLMYKGHRLKY